MNNINRFNLPITTGVVTNNTTKPNSQKNDTNNGKSFNEILNSKISLGLNFSKHAISRIDQRGIDVSAEKMERLNKGMELARDKGLSDVLVMVDKTAFIVNAKSSTIITTVGAEDTVGNVFTNIEGTVVI